MLRSTLTIWISIIYLTFLHAQSGCPGCLVSVPPGLPADTVYLPGLPDGEAGVYYDQDVSFRLPKTTTPVHAIDSTTPSGLTISKFEIVSVDGLPPGLYWQPNKFNFDVSNETDGCVKFCGTPHVSDSFELTVKLKATVLFLTQEATFPMKLYIAPKVSNTVGFSMTNPEGCGSATVTLTNNIPSGGSAGYSYSWDFGDGSPVYNGEDPQPHTYDQPGVYPVSYHATVDTAGYFLESIKVIHVGCVDELGLGKPDLFLQIFEPNNGPLIFDSSPYVNNTPLPYTFPVGIELGTGNYLLKVIDEDGGLKGGDDNCGTTSFNYLSNGTIVAGDLTVEFIIVHPVEEITSIDTVIVYPQPVNPVLNAANGTAACADENNLVLMSSYGSGNQWLLNGSNIPGATDFTYSPLESGFYQAQIVSQYGCVATSDSMEIEIYPLPAEPVWYNYRNSLRVYDTAALPANYALQWYLGTNPIPGETGIWYCSMTSGVFGLEVTDLETGCTNFYANQVTNDPQYDCTVATASPDLIPFEIRPNPATEVVTLHFPEASSPGQLMLRDITGKVILQKQIKTGQHISGIDVHTLPAGIYLLDLILKEGHRTEKLVVSH